MMQPRDAHLDHNDDDESDCAAAAATVQGVLSVSINHNDNDDDDDGRDSDSNEQINNKRRGGRSRLASRSDSPTSTMLACSPIKSAAPTDANQQQQQEEEVPAAAVALVGARKRKAVRVVKHAQVSPRH